MDIHRECALQLFMTKDEKGYWLYEPRQTATSCDVTFERNNVMEDEYVLVMDIHNIMLRAGMNGVFQELSVEDIFV